MADPFLDERLRDLLASADALLDTLRNPRHDSPSAKEVMRQLDTVHRDIGRCTHDLWQAHVEELQAEPEAIDELTDLEAVDEGMHGIGFGRPIHPGDEQVRRPPPQVVPEHLWVDRLQDLLALLDTPTEDTDAVALALEASRVQWATVGLSAGWAQFPEPIQVALLGLLAARCRWLQQHLAVDFGPRVALQRLREYRMQAGLTSVVALVPEHEPESGTWRGDALHWWDMLTAGLSAG